MVAATIRLRSASSNSVYVGLILNSPLTLATLTSEIGPAKGISDTASADDAASAASASGGVSNSPEIRLRSTCVSKRQLSGNNGLSARSIRREVRISASEGLASRLKKPPGNLPVAAYFSLYSTVNGRKSNPSLTSLFATTVASIMVSPMRTTTAPSACFASLPVSIEIVLPSFSENDFVIPFSVIVVLEFAS